MKLLLLAFLAPAFMVVAMAFVQRPLAPEVRFTMLSGESLAISDLRGKVVLVNFWATSCTTSRSRGLSWFACGPCLFRRVPSRTG